MMVVGLGTKRRFSMTAPTGRQRSQNVCNHVTKTWAYSRLLLFFLDGLALLKLSQAFRPSAKLRFLSDLTVVDGFEGNPTNLRDLLRVEIDAPIWFFLSRCFNYR